MNNTFFRFFICSVSLLVCWSDFAYSQSEIGEAGTQSARAIAVLPTGYQDIKLKAKYDDVSALLQRTPAFGYRGERDVSLLPNNRILIEAPGASSFYARSWFQFYEDELYIITINLNDEKTDYNSVFQSLVKKYGDPAFLNPKKAVWQDNNVIMSLEHPLTLKYVDVQIFNELGAESQVLKSNNEDMQMRFLEGL
ncbi:MAG: hypothetical protein Ta2A_16500 [Treponemataceae bacterium]|nr:MAG: hypothetical protein Ta2A_16500 [Treponemataceae bacterium]